jgi:hypothetical protein
MKYYDIDTLVHLANHPKLEELHEQLMQMSLVTFAKGSTHNHQAWDGGYLDHVAEVMNIAVRLYADLTAMRQLPFTLSDALIVLYLHDLEKPFTGSLGLPKQERREFRDALIVTHGIELSPIQQNALTYVEVEFDYTNTERKMGELACFCHICDVLSARLWYDRGAERSW